MLNSSLLMISPTATKGICQWLHNLETPLHVLRPIIRSEMSLQDLVRAGAFVQPELVGQELTMDMCPSTEFKAAE